MPPNQEMLELQKQTFQLLTAHTEASERAHKDINKRLTALELSHAEKRGRAEGHRDLKAWAKAAAPIVAAVLASLLATSSVGGHP